MKRLSFTLGLLTAALLLPQVALADTGNCQSTYGSYGGYGVAQCVNGNISINKTVQNPSTNQFVDNLGVNDAKFKPLQNVNFQLIVSNTGNATVHNVVVKDIFPQFIDFATADGSFNNDNKTLTITLDHLDAGQSKTYSVVGRTVKAESLPADTGVTCVVNQSTATADNQPTAQDNAQLCIEKPVLAATTKGGLTVFNTPTVTKTPGTGPDALSLLALIPAAFAGLKLRKNAIRS